MKAKDYNLIERCVDDGIEYGYNRAHKHVQDPNPEHIKSAIRDAVMLEITEWFDFEQFQEGD
jgi:hypothetical protein